MAEKQHLDVAELRLVFRPKHIYAIAAILVGITAGVVTGWLALKTEVAVARQEVQSLEPRVARIECLIEQQNNFQIYGLKPAAPCSR